MWEMTLNGLKPCPFCKSQNTKETSKDQVHCHDCNASASIDRWNNRPLEDELVAGALKIAVNSCHMSFNSGHNEINK